MSLFKKLFGSGNDSSEENKEKEVSPFNPETKIPMDELFTFNFKKNGGKFLYCETTEELKEQFLNILEENDWFECDAVCYEPSLSYLLEENKLNHVNPKEPKFLLSSCENLIADEGSVLLTSNQIKQRKPHELPTNMVVFAKTSQILENKSEGLREIKKRYDKDYPTNITTIKYFEKAKEEDFLQYGSAAKNLYLLLLEDL
jgi:L-lactate utilization protein LutC